ncbi:lantibiotic dehydratase [Kitasatospora sp. NPDC008050]|uniref:lantibiotic dehydratase n=1 Tax=Kitasatospora sp. NPDC008050 TaxID=3364021 RepID=UPI0036E3AD16
MLRVGGLPVEAVHALRAPESLAWAERLLAEEERLTELGARLSEPLSALVKATEDAGRRRDLLAVRRQVFNNRLPDRPAELGALAAELGGATGELLAEWLRARRHLARLADRGTATLATELLTTRAELRKLAEREELRLGLLLASPSLVDRLDGQPADPAAPLDKRARKLERSLLSYLYRTACKTSPFSTFTAVAAGTFTQQPGTPSQQPGVPSQQADAPFGGRPDAPADLLLGPGRTSHPRLNVVVLARLAELIAADPERRGDLPLMPASGWELTEDRVRYVRRSVTAGDAAATVSFDAAHDRLFFLRLSGVLEHLLEFFGERPLIRYGELAELLAARTGGSTADAERYLTALLDVGMLQLPALGTDVHAADPLRAFQAALRSLDRPWAEAAAARLAGPAAAIDRYPAADAPTRRALLGALRRDLTALQRELAAGEPPALPQTLLYEDVAAGEPVADTTEWREAAARLRELARILPVFDLGLARRLTLKGFFLARFGPGGSCPDLLQLVHDFHEDIFNQYLQFTALKPEQGEDGAYLPEENWLGRPELTALDRARGELSRRMAELFAKLPDGSEELLLEPADLTAVAGELAPLGEEFAPHSHFVQLARRAGEPLVVLNHSYGGLAFPFTRFTHCFDRPDAAGLPARLRQELLAAQPEGAVFAEVTAGSATTNLNLHARLTEYEIVCPGETSTAPEAAQLRLDDLLVEHDPAADRLLLRSRRLNREVVPLYLGYLVPMVLPEVPRSLLLFSPTSRVTPQLWRGVPAGPPTAGATRRPRVRYGNLVLQRRSWTVAPEARPAAAAGRNEAERFLDWQRWRRRLGLPRQLFVRVHPLGGAGPRLGAVKPQYLDFASPLSLLALEGLLTGGPAELVLEEMLPGEQELHVRSAQGRHVAEVALEIIPRTTAAATGQREGEPSHD